MTIVRKPNGQFAEGWRGGPGRRPGQRNRITELALQALGDDFAEHGSAVIAQVRREKPHHYLSIVANLLPRQVMHEKYEPFAELSNEDLAELEQHYASMKAKLVRQIEQRAASVNGPPQFNELPSKQSSD